MEGLRPPSKPSTEVTEDGGGRGNDSTGAKQQFPQCGLQTPGVPETLQRDLEVRTIFI